jgi:hypothetical protein
VIFWVFTICIAFYVAVTVTVALVVSFRVFSPDLVGAASTFPAKASVPLACDRVDR